MRFPQIGYGKIAVTMIALSLCGFSQPPDTQAPAGATRTVVGTISFVQKDTKQFVLKTTEGREYIIGIDGRTTVSSIGRNLNWFDLTVGMDASVVFAPRGNQFVAITVEASKGTPAPKIDSATAQAKDEAEPITVKGKIAAIKPDLTEITLKTFDDKDITMTIDDDLRTRLKNGDTTLPKVDKGSEVSAVYVVQNDRNKLVSLRDLVVKESPPAVAAAPSKTVQGQSSGTTKAMYPPNQPVQPLPRLAQSQLPLVGMPLPVGFTATTNNPLGTLVGQIVQIKNDMIILTNNSAAQSTGIAQAGAQTTTNTNPPNSNQSNQAVPNPTSQATQNPTNPIPQNPLAPGTANNIGPRAGGNFFVILGANSKEPFMVDQRTRIVINNRGVRLGEIMEGARIQATFEALADGTRHATMITATGNVPANVTNPTTPTAGQQTNQQTAQQNAPTAGQANVFVGTVVSRKTDTLIVRNNNANDLAFFMTVNSIEPLRTDEGTRVQINGQEAKITDLQVSMQINAFLEMVNNIRRVIGITAGTSTGTGTNGTNTGLTGKNK